MDEVAKEALRKKTAEFAAFRTALTDESDRGCALFAAAYLDIAVCDLIRSSLIEHKNIDDELFTGTAPISTFSARIRLAFYMGKISKAMRSDLEIIRKIRNDFAHHAVALSFDTEAIANRCRALKFSYHEHDEKARAHFTAAASGLLATLHGWTLKAVRPAIQSDDVPTEAEKRALREVVDAILNREPKMSKAAKAKQGDSNDAIDP